MRFLFVLVACALPVFLFAQSVEGTRQQPVDSQKADLSSLKVSFSAPNLDSPLQLPSVAMSGPPVCGPGGRSLVQFLTNAPYYNKKHVYSISADGKIVHYPVEDITGLTDQWVTFADPGITSAVVLFHARKVGAGADSRERYYMALFDYDGKLRDYTDLDLGFDPIEIVQLADDRFLVSGSDVARVEPRFVLIDGRGTVIRDLGAAFMSAGSQLDGMLGAISVAGANISSLSPSQKIPLALSLLRPVHSSHSLLILEPTSRGPIIEISLAGDSHVVTLKLPQKQIAHDLLIAKGRWFVRTSVEGSDTQWNLLEIDPDTGQALRWIDTSGVPASSIACTTESGFYAIRWIDHKPYLLDGGFVH